MKLNDIRKARERIAPHIIHTPCPFSELLSERYGARIYSKLDNLQMTGSFKERGACNKLLALDDDQKRRGVCTASAGNHAQAVAHQGRKLGIRVTVFMPKGSPLIKITNTENFGADVRIEGDNYDESLSIALAHAKKEGLEFIHGFDDENIIAGQGTIGIEILEQVQDGEVDVIIVPVGGGGLIAGIAAAVKQIRPQVRMIGVEAARVPSLTAALAMRKPVLVPHASTIADGIAVRKVGERPYRLIEKYVDDVITVDEDEIASAILELVELEKTVAEGAAAVTLAALSSGKVVPAGKTTVLCVCGGNIDVNILSRVIEKGLVKIGRVVRFRVPMPDRPGSLARLSAILADSGANVLEIHHQREFSRADVGVVEIECIVETRNHEHTHSVISSVEASGFNVILF